MLGQVRLSTGRKLGAIAWEASGPASRGNLLFLHGWMDNAATASIAGPVFAANGWNVLALDLPGHGHSDHYDAQSVYGPHSYVLDTVGALQSLGWLGPTPLAMVGHSMGGAISLCAGAALQRYVDGIVSLDNVGPPSAPAALAPVHMADALESAARVSNRRARPYPSFMSAAEARAQTAKTFPGDQFLSIEAALPLVKRGTRVHEDSEECTFTHDPRLVQASATYMPEEAVMGYLSTVQVPTAIILGSRGWPYPTVDQRHHALAGSLARHRAAVEAHGWEAVMRAGPDVASGESLAASKIIKSNVKAAATATPVEDDAWLHWEVVPGGGHHLHLEPDTAEHVTQAMLAWLDGPIHDAASARADVRAKCTSLASASKFDAWCASMAEKASGGAFSSPLLELQRK